MGGREGYAPLDYTSQVCAKAVGFYRNDHNARSLFHCGAGNADKAGQVGQKKGGYQRSLLDSLSTAWYTKHMSEGKITLGGYLRAARENKGYSLRDVQRETGISNAYLSQIESGKIIQPSPSVLFKLSRIYDVPYSTLMALASYPVPIQEREEPSLSLARRIGPVTEEEAEALVEYLRFLRSRRKLRR